MQTIDWIINRSLYTKETLEQCENKGICNWCGWKGGVDFEKLIQALPYFNQEKWKKLLEDLHLICNMHDLDYELWVDFFDFIKANYELAINIYYLLNWTSKFKRILMFLIVFLGTTIKGWKYFKTK